MKNFIYSNIKPLINHINQKDNYQYLTFISQITTSAPSYNPTSSNLKVAHSLTNKIISQLLTKPKAL